MKKKILGVITVLLTLGLFVGCTAKESTEVKEIKVVVPDGIPSMATAKMIKENPEITKGYNISYTIEKTPENIVSEVLKGEVDIAIVPSNVAATAYNKGAGYKIAGTVGWGSFQIISTEKDSAMEDLKGNEVYNIGKGLTPDIVTQTVLKDKGIDPSKDINFSYLNGVTELAPTIIAGKTKYAVLPEPAYTQVSLKKEIYTVLDLNEEWKKLNDSEYGFPQATIIVKEELLQNDSKFVEKFLKEIEESCKFANDKKEELANYCEEIGVSANKAIIPKAIEKSNIKYVSIQDSYKEYETYYKKLSEFDAKTIGGKIPDEGIFMEK